jgi:hypothetical protein
MAMHVYDEAGNKDSGTHGKRKHADIRRQFEEQEHTNNQAFDTAGWRDRFIFWVASSGISLRAASSRSLFDLLTFGNPKVKPLVPQAHATVHQMVTNRYRAAKDTVIQSLTHAKSGITISFDHWKANNDMLDLLGVVAHYLDREYKPKTVVIALKDALGSHTGDNIAEQLIEVLRDYDICDRVIYFAADNATNNDKALRLLTRDLDSRDRSGEAATSLSRAYPQSGLQSHPVWRRRRLHRPSARRGRSGRSRRCLWRYDFRGSPSHR